MNDNAFCVRSVCDCSSRTPRPVSSHAVTVERGLLGHSVTVHWVHRALGVDVHIWGHAARGHRGCGHSGGAAATGGATRLLRGAAATTGATRGAAATGGTGSGGGAGGRSSAGSRSPGASVPCPVSSSGGGGKPHRRSGGASNAGPHRRSPEGSGKPAPSGGKTAGRCSCTSTCTLAAPAANEAATSAS